MTIGLLEPEPATVTAPALVTFTNGLTVSYASFRLALELDDQGLLLRAEDGKLLLSPADKVKSLSAETTAKIKHEKAGLLAICGLCTEMLAKEEAEA